MQGAVILRTVGSILILGTSSSFELGYGEGRIVDPPIIPVALDAYRQWERWPYQRIGVRAYMRSTYDRSGGNEAADAGHFLYQLADDKNVSLDVPGAGVLYFVRTNHWHGSPWHYEVDGNDHIVQESSTANPDHPVPNSTFLPANLFPNPLAWTWADTKGADLNWVPIPFEKSFRMAYSRTHYGTGYYIYHQYMSGAKLSQPIESWDGKTAPAVEVLKLINRAGTDLLPHGGTPEGKRLSIHEVFGGTSLAKRGRLLVLNINRAPSAIRAIEFSVPRDEVIAFGRSRLRITWDNRAEPSVNAPISLFYGAGTLYNRDNREYLVKAFPVNIRFDKDRASMACFFPMPFFKSARLELEGNGKQSVTGIRWRIRYVPFKDASSQVGYFHATYQDHPQPGKGKDLELLDTRGAEGSLHWSGHLVGTSWIFSHNANLGTLEGDPRFFFDDSQSPQAQGTGTEEWGGGGDYWGGLNMTLPFAGHPCGAKDRKSANNEEDKIESAYRFLLADLFPFGKNARITLEHGGTNQSTEHYETVTYWYGAPAPSLVRTDELQIGDKESEDAHKYRSPKASEPFVLTSRYEWGVDTVDGKVVFPASTDRGRNTLGTSEFTLNLNPDNLGVLLRRKLDFSFPNQRAEVSIADVKPGSKFKPAGIWYTAGSNTCVYSNPREELGETQHIAQTSNRRFREEEFLIPRALTQGKDAIRVRIKFVPVNRPLYPGGPNAETAWSEMRYTAYSYVMPKWKP
jgi:hypothetical protein